MVSLALEDLFEFVQIGSHAKIAHALSLVSCVFRFG